MPHVHMKDHIIEITDFGAPQLDVYARLSEGQLLNRHEPDKGMFIAESPKVIGRALDAGCVPVSILTAGLDVLTQLTGFRLTRGMLCAMRRPRLKTTAEVCEGARRIAVLENVMNPTNVGAIFRSAAALNMDGILLTPAGSDPLYRRSIRVSMGTVFQIPWAFLDGTDGIKTLRDMGFTTVAMALREDSLSITSPQLMQAERLAVVLGTEGDGLAPDTIAGCDHTVRIPMAHGVDSLNVAAASAVAFWQLGNGGGRDRKG